MAIVTYTQNSFDIEIELGAYTNENALEAAISAIRNPIGPKSQTEYGLAGAISVFNTTTVRPNAARILVIVFNQHWVNQEQVSTTELVENVCMQTSASDALMHHHIQSHQQKPEDVDLLCTRRELIPN